MENWITEFIGEHGYFGVCFLLLLENIFPPIPSEIILTFSGFVTGFTTMTKTGVIIAATIGSVVGAMVLYSIGMLVDTKRLERIVERRGRWLRLTKKDLRRAEGWFEKHGPWTVFFCRLVPLVRSLISIPAGMSHMNFPLFILLTTIGSFIWNAILVTIGFKVGENWESIIHYMDVYSMIVYVLLATSGFAGIIGYTRFRRKRA
ncbi:DedA family protein [Sporosarcina thermotolerans]|uniref:DedA family protein n=1 Tax=Sporosarcina thermotolerans TaxID=633404 RepID=A0AAW9AE01_9BACL|nr:DedA family protein [Sporosarcina thermotolerans]MDW0118823.1 DedA family protein [Sporosarcina thermotolerans]WHT48514.1 DedA family protein [Sporosarcina thermotolerans]